MPEQERVPYDCPSCGPVDGFCGQHRCEAMPVQRTTPRPPGWRPISTVPDDSATPVLVFCPKAHRGTPSCEVVIICRDDAEPDGLSYWTTGGPNAGDDLWFDADERPTHWMPLPGPPHAE